MHAKASTFLERLLISQYMPKDDAKHWRLSEPFLFDSRLAEGVLAVTQADADLTRKLLLTPPTLPFRHTCFVIDYPDKLVAYLIEQLELGLLINIFEDFKQPDMMIVPYPFSFTLTDYNTAQTLTNVTLDNCQTLAHKIKFRDMEGNVLSHVVPVDLTKDNLVTYLTTILTGGISLKLYGDKDRDIKYLPFTGITVANLVDQSNFSHNDFLTECLKESAGSVRRMLGLLYLLNNSNITETKEKAKPKSPRLYNRKPLPWLRKHIVNLKVPHLVAESFGPKDKPEPTGRHMPWHTVKAHWFRTRRGNVDCKHAWINDPASSIRQFCTCGAKRILRSYPNGKGDRSLGMVKKVYHVTP